LRGSNQAILFRQLTFFQLEYHEGITFNEIQEKLAIGIGIAFVYKSRFLSYPIIKGCQYGAGIEETRYS